MEQNKVVIGVGSNIEPEKNISKAQSAIANQFNLLRTSSLIETEPIGFLEQANFLNCAFLIETELDSAALKSWLKDLENKLGRLRTDNKYGPRTIDLDIIVWNQKIVDPEVYERDFLQNSITELLPDLNVEN